MGAHLTVLHVGSSGPAVTRLQEQLDQLGFGCELGAPGFFGEPLAASVCRYQRFAGIEIDGRVGEETRCALIADLGAQRQPELHDCPGSLGLTLREEGFVGEPYQPPGEASGVTLDIGFDLGQQTVDRLVEVYSICWSPPTLQWLGTAIGLHGPDAARWLQAARLEGRICRLSREAAAEILPRIAGDYWRQLVERFPALIGVPHPIATAIMSLAYNRGATNPGLQCLAAPLMHGDWTRAARFIELMGISKPAAIADRRRVEADHIRTALA